jgi:hypothetical protein
VLVVDLKRLIAGLSALVVVAGLLIFTLTHGGPLNRWPRGARMGDYLVEQYGIDLPLAGPRVGMVLLGIGGAGLVLALCWRRGPGEPPLTVKRLLSAYALYALFLGTLFLCFAGGGLLNPWNGGEGRYVLRLDWPGPVVGWSLLGVGAVGLVVVWSMKPRATDLWSPPNEAPAGVPGLPRQEPRPAEPTRPEPGLPDLGIYARDTRKPPPHE